MARSNKKNRQRKPFIRKIFRIDTRVSMNIKSRMTVRIFNDTNFINFRWSIYKESPIVISQFEISSCQKTKMNLKYFFAAQIVIFAAAVYAAVVTCDNKGLFRNESRCLFLIQFWQWDSDQTVSIQKMHWTWDQRISYCQAFWLWKIRRVFKLRLGHITDWLHRWRWRMLVTKCVGDNFKILVTALAFLSPEFHIS